MPIARQGPRSRSDRKDHSAQIGGDGRARCFQLRQTARGSLGCSARGLVGPVRRLGGRSGTHRKGYREKDQLGFVLIVGRSREVSRVRSGPLLDSNF
jgi:hypothetical protein